MIEVSSYIYYVLEHETYELREQDATESYEPLKYNFLTTMFGSILHAVNWDVIIDYHKEPKGLDNR